MMTKEQKQNEVAIFMCWHIDDVRTLSDAELRETINFSPYLRAFCGYQEKN
jgi:hypothetical protein